MKILMISDSTIAIGGAEKVMYDLKDKLEENNHEVYIWGTNSYNIIQNLSSIFNIKYYLKLKKYLINNKFDIIHIHKFNSILSPSIFFALKGKGRIILHVHDFSFYCPKLGVTLNGNECKGGIFHFNCKRSVNRFLILNIFYDFLKWNKFILQRYFIKKYVDVFICPSKKLQEYMIDSLKLPNKKVIYIPNFIELEGKYKLNFGSILDNRFLYVGRISNEKGIEIAIKAFELLVKKEGLSDIYLDIIGIGQDKYLLEKLVIDLGLDNNIKFLGKIDNDNLKEYYEKSIGLIMPSVWLENNPLVAIEGMKYGKPIIATNIGGFPDLVENGKNGYLFTIGNYIELANKIKNLYKNKDLSTEMGLYSYRKLIKDFSCEKSLNCLLNLYKN